MKFCQRRKHNYKASEKSYQFFYHNKLAEGTGFEPVDHNDRLFSKQMP